MKANPFYTTNVSSIFAKAKLSLFKAISFEGAHWLKLPFKCCVAEYENTKKKLIVVSFLWSAHICWLKITCVMIQYLNLQRNSWANESIKLIKRTRLHWLANIWHFLIAPAVQITGMVYSQNAGDSANAYAAHYFIFIFAELRFLLLQI